MFQEGARFRSGPRPEQHHRHRMRRRFVDTDGMAVSCPSEAEEVGRTACRVFRKKPASNAFDRASISGPPNNTLVARGADVISAAFIIDHTAKLHSSNPWCRRNQCKLVCSSIGNIVGAFH